MVKRSEQTFHQKKYVKSHQTHENIPNIIIHWKSAN